MLFDVRPLFGILGYINLVSAMLTMLMAALVMVMGGRGESD